MSRPQISIPSLPPILFLNILLTTTIALTLPHSTTANPLPGPVGTQSIPIKNGTHTPHITTPAQPLRTRDIVGIVLGVVFGTIVVVVMATFLTRLDWVIRKRRERLAAKNQAIKAEMRELEVEQGVEKKLPVVVETREVVLDDDVSEITLIGDGHVDFGVGVVIKDVPRAMGSAARVDVRKARVWW